MAQHPFEAAAVDRDAAVDEAAEPAGDPVAASAAFVAQQLGAHHRRQGERHDCRDHDRDGERQGKLAEHAADEPGHEQQRDEHRDQREGQRDDGEADLARPAHRGVVGRIPLLHVADDVLDHHDRIVDHETGADGQRHQREVVEREARKPHHAERRDQRQRQRHTGDDRRPDGAQEDEHHQHHEADREHQGELHVADRGADGVGAVLHHGEFRADGQDAAQARQFRLDVLDRLHHVGARLAADIDDDGLLAIVPARDLGVFQPVDDVRDIAQHHGVLVAVGDDQRAISFGCGKLVVRRDRVGLECAVEGALRASHVGVDDRLPDVLQRKAIGGEPRQVGLDAHRRLDAALRRHIADAGNLAQALRQQRIGEIA